MNASPVSPRTAKAGLVLLDPVSGVLQRIIALQYNPDALTRSLQSRGVAGEGADLTEALRLTAPANETITMEVVMDATDQLEFPEENPVPTQVGLHAQLAAMEQLLHPTAAAIRQTDALAQQGFLEIIPASGPLTVLVFGRQRVVPVRLTEMSITEEAFDPVLNPIRAKASLTLKVLSAADADLRSQAGVLYMVHHQRREALANRHTFGSFADLGIGGLT